LAHSQSKKRYFMPLYYPLKLIEKKNTATP
jgi:hypothetical protein